MGGREEDQLGSSGKKNTTTKKCALCEGEARMYCDSDGAALCWGCDARVHGANFLVARHARALLCRACRVPTGWTASGARVTPTASLCSNCCFGVEGNSRPLDDDDDQKEEEEEKVGKGNEEEEEDGENQVVPWGMPVTTTDDHVSSSSSDRLTLKEQSSSSSSSSSRSKDDHGEADDQPVSNTAATKLIEFDIIRGVMEDREENGDVLKVGWNQRLRSKRKRSMAFARAAVSSARAGGSRPLSCQSARRAIPPPDFIHC